MAQKIQIKRGAAANLPTLDVGEPAFTTDEHGVFVGSAAGNVEILTEESPVVFYDRAQTLTETQKGQAQKNIGAGNNNPNLLDNWWFGTGVINQRSMAASGTFGNNVYTLDRWITSYSASAPTYTLDENGLSMSVSGGFSWFTQKIENYLALYGKTLTASVLLQNGTIITGTATVNSAGRADFYNANGVYLYQATNVFGIRLQNTSIAIKAVKLEIGSVSTLAMDAPPNPAEELAKCQRYFVRLIGTTASLAFGVGTAISASRVRMFIPLPTTLRTNSPTVTLTGSITLWRGTGANGNITSVNVLGRTANALNLYGDTTATLTVGELIFLNSSSTSSYIDVSCDLT